MQALWGTRDLSEFSVAMVLTHKVLDTGEVKK